MSTTPATDAPGRYLLRPARADDLGALERLAAASAIGITSLRTELAGQLERSAQSFASAADDASGEEHYLFVLEDLAAGGRLIGTAGIAASAGFNDRFYSYRNEFIVQASAALGARNRIHTLHLCHDLTGVTLLTGFHIDAAYADTLAPQLLSRGRLMFIAGSPQRFAPRIAAENPGLADDAGHCPFWDAVGRRFFDMDYPQAERRSGGRSPKAWIAELMPQSPLYVPLLPEQAQWALGQLHPVGELPFQILMDEGFDGDTYLNIFDGGPTAEGRVQMLKTVTRRRTCNAHSGPADCGAAGASMAVTEPWHLLSAGDGEEFRATVLPVRDEPQLDAATAAALNWQPGMPVHVARLDAVGDEPEVEASPLPRLPDAPEGGEAQRPVWGCP